MIIKRNKFFSKRKKKESQESSPEKLALAGVGTYVGGKTGAALLKYKLNRDIDRTVINSPNEKAVKRKLINEAKDRGIQFYWTSEDTHYAGSPAARRIRRDIDKLIEKHPELKKEFEKDPRNRHIGKDHVLINKQLPADRSVDTIAHEVGHAYNSVKGRPSSIAGRISHKLTPISNSTVGLDSKKGRRNVDAALFLHGVAQGIKKENNKKDGKKDGNWTKYGSIALPLALAAPSLVAEGAASRSAMKLIKKHGADKTTKRLAKKKLTSAWGTYAAHFARPIAAGGSGELVGRGIGKYINQDPTEKD